jgi:hypothetical protein
MARAAIVYYVLCTKWKFLLSTTSTKLIFELKFCQRDSRSEFAIIYTSIKSTRSHHTLHFAQLTIIKLQSDQTLQITAHECTRLWKSIYNKKLVIIKLHRCLSHNWTISKKAHESLLSVFRKIAKKHPDKHSSCFDPSKYPAKPNIKIMINAYK